MRQAPPLKLDPLIEAALSSYIPSSILAKMGTFRRILQNISTICLELTHFVFFGPIPGDVTGDFAATWTRGRRESGNTAEQWASDLRTISTIFCCLAVEGHSGGMGGDNDADKDAELYHDLFRKVGLFP